MKKMPEKKVLRKKEEESDRDNQRRSRSILIKFSTEFNVCS
jgi:hypothetical protein